MATQLLNGKGADRPGPAPAIPSRGECEAVCPKPIPLEFIARLNRDLFPASFRPRLEAVAVVGVPRVLAHEDTEGKEP